MRQLDGLYGRLLTVVGFKGIVVLLVVGGMDGCFHILFSLIKKCESLIITIVIYEDDLFFGCTDEVGYERIGIPHTACSKELFLWLLMCMDEEGYFFLVLLQAIFDAKETIVNMLLKSYQLFVDSIAFEEVLLENG